MMRMRMRSDTPSFSTRPCSPWWGGWWAPCRRCGGPGSLGPCSSSASGTAHTEQSRRGQRMGLTVGSGRRHTCRQPHGATRAGRHRRGAL